MFNPSAYENSRHEGIGVLEIVKHPESAPSQARLFVPLKRTELRGEAVGPLAALQLTQVYGYAKQQCDQVLEAVYRFPLPGDAAVTGVRVRFGGAEIWAELKERETAEADCERAKQEGKQAALLTRESPELFTLQVAGIQPDQEVKVETHYVQRARIDGTGWSLRIPLTTAPRYVRSDEVASRPAQGQPLLLLRDPGHRFALDLTFCGAGAVESPTHSLDVTSEGDRTRVRLQEREVIPDRDCVLSWRPPQKHDRALLQAFLHDDPASGQVYFLGSVSPPAVHDKTRGVPREVVLLVDHSGSMEGAKWKAADWAVKKFLSGLGERDALALGLFHNTTRWFSETLRPASAAVVAEAVRFLEQHRDSGGTELGVALEQALHLERTEDERARHVLVITDAQVSDAGRILRLADEESKRAERRRVSVLCIDAAPNSFLANELAERGGGIARFLTSNPNEDDVTTALDEVLADWSKPLWTGLRLEVNRPELHNPGRQAAAGSRVGWSAVDVGDLPAGRTVWVTGRVPRNGSAPLTFRVATAEDREVAACRLDVATGADERPALKALFGAQRVLGLEFLIHSSCIGDELTERLRRLGYDPEKVLPKQAHDPSKVYAENKRRDLEKALRGLLVHEALDYGLACSETAFVAVRTEAGKQLAGTILVANALPNGWSQGFLSGRVAHFQLQALADSAGLGLVSRLGARRALIESDLEYDVAPPPFQGVASRVGGPSMPQPADHAKSAPLFSGIPQFTKGEAVLFDSSRTEDARKLPDRVTLSRIEVRFPGATPQPESLDSGLSLLIFVDDLASPRARVSLADLVRQLGERPLNLLKLPAQAMRIVLFDPAEVWARNAPHIEVALGWLG